MTKLEDYVGKNVILVDTNNKTWNGIVESYDPDDAFDDYEGESIDVRVDKTLVCFGMSEIKSIQTA